MRMVVVAHQEVLQLLLLQQRMLKLPGSRWKKCAAGTSNKFKPFKLSCRQSVLAVPLETLVRPADRWGPVNVGWNDRIPVPLSTT